MAAEFGSSSTVDERAQPELWDGAYIAAKIIPCVDLPMETSSGIRVGPLPLAALGTLGATLTALAVLVTSVAGSSVPVIAGPAPRQSAMLAAGVDMTPVGTARDIERAKQSRREKP